VNVTLHQDYARELARLDGSVKAKAWDLLTKLTADPDGHGLNLKLPQQSRDRRVRVARVDRFWRAVLFLIGQGEQMHLVLAAIKPHDEAYEWAGRASLGVNHASGALELRLTEAVEAAAPALESDTVAVAPGHRAPASAMQDAPQCLPFTVTELTGLGIAEGIASRAISIRDEGTLLELVDGLPRWQEGMLLDLVGGKGLDDVRREYSVTAVDPRRADSDEEIAAALHRPSTRMEFGLVTDDEALRRVLDGDFLAWRLFLHPSQRAAAYRPVYSGAFRLNGGAGTGKTVVALHRAAFLAGQHENARVLLCTFNRTLAAQLRADLVRLAGSDVADRVDVLGVDQLARRVLVRVTGTSPGPLPAAAEEQLWAETLGGLGLDGDPLLTWRFLRDDLRLVVLAQRLEDSAAYLRASRKGRGTRLDRAQRLRAWQAMAAYQELERRDGRMSYAGLAALASRAATAASPSGWYDHVVVDEGQDLQPVHWNLLRALVPEGPNDLFICEDGHQRIYGSRVVLSRHGISTRGRSRRLTLNYRTTRQNLALSLSVLGGVPVQDIEGEDESVSGYVSRLTGPDPVMSGYPSRQQEVDAVVNTVVDRWRMAGDGSRPSIAVLTRRNRDADQLAQRLKAAGLPARVSGPEDAPAADTVTVCSMHRAKGAEFEHVVVAHVDATTVPDAYALQSTDPDERDDVLARERLLLYVACSRARESTTVTWSGQPSPFLLGAASA
jgi:AAA domain/UvrD-like helicase C-terminal domain